MPKIAEIEGTPNPNAMKFILKEPLSWGITRSYDNAEAAKGDALASQGCPVTALHRSAIGALTLGDLPEGQWCGISAAQLVPV